MPGALSADLYEISMAAGYHAAGLLGDATFELWVRELPPERGYLVVAGLDQALEYLEEVRFQREDIDYLRSVPALRGVQAAFFDEYLANFRFRGDVWAMPEGTPAFAGEPLVRVTASLPEGQIVETALLATVLFQTMVASKASRVVHAAQGRPVIEFGGRRAHGVDAATLAARSAFIGGCGGTSNLDAGSRFDIPVSGTMGHSWVMSHESESEAFQRYVDLYGAEAVLLIDTYDTLNAARHIAARGLHPAAVRLDSGDLESLSVAVRRIFDTGGHGGTRILASGDLDEHRISQLVASGAPIDGFGVGTALSTSGDAPSLAGVYKLVEVDRGGGAEPTAKRSPTKQTQPGAKQVWRSFRRSQLDHDQLTLDSERPSDGSVPLLQCVMRGGRRLEARPELGNLRQRSMAQVRELPQSVRALRQPGSYEVRPSPLLLALGQDARVNTLGP